ncbi:TPA: hypothetical protein ACH3X2_012232 [Trebouxia sp. C0005]
MPFPLSFTPGQLSPSQYHLRKQVATDQELRHLTSTPEFQAWAARSSRKTHPQAAALARAMACFVGLLLFCVLVAWSLPAGSFKVTACQRLGLGSFALPPVVEYCRLQDITPASQLVHQHADDCARALQHVPLFKAQAQNSDGNVGLSEDIWLDDGQVMMPSSEQSADQDPLLATVSDEASSSDGNHGITFASIDNQWQLSEDCPEIQQVHPAADFTASHGPPHLNESVMLSESSKPFASLAETPDKASPVVAGWIWLAAIAAVFVLIILWKTRAALAPALHWMTHLPQKLVRSFWKPQVAPHAAAARSKQQHAATTDIAAFAVSNHVALGISDATRAVMGHAFPPQASRDCQHGRLQLAYARTSGPMVGLGQAGMEDDTAAVVPVLASLLQQPAADRRQAGQNLMLALANAMIPLVPDGPYPYPNAPLGFSVAVILAPNQGGVCAVRIARRAVPMISFVPISHPRSIVKMPGALGGSVAALTAPMSSAALSLAPVAIRSRQSVPKSLRRPPEPSRILVSQQDVVAYMNVLLYQLRRTRQGWFATLARLEQQNQQLLGCEPPDDRLLQFHQDLSVARFKCVQLEAEKASKEHTLQTVLSRFEAQGTTLAISQEAEGQLRAQLHTLTESCATLEAQVQSGTEAGAALKARYAALEIQAAKSEARAEEAVRMRKLRVEAEMRRASDAENYADRRYAAQRRACSERMDEAAATKRRMEGIIDNYQRDLASLEGVFAKKNAELEDVYAKKDAELENLHAKKHAELDARLAQQSAKEAQLANMLKESCGEKTKHMAEVAKWETLAHATAAQHEATAAALEKREERIRCDKQELLARERVVKKDEAHIAAEKTELDENWEKYRLYYDDQDQELAERSSKVEADEKRLQAKNVQLKEDRASVRAELGKSQEAVTKIQEGLQQERLNMQAQFNTHCQEYEAEVLRQAREYQQSMQQPSSDALFNLLVQGGMSVQDATGWAASQQAIRESVRLEAVQYVQQEQRRLEEMAQAHQRQCDAAVQQAKSQAERAGTSTSEEAAAKVSAEELAAEANTARAQAESARMQAESAKAAAESSKAAAESAKAQAEAELSQQSQAMKSDAEQINQLKESLEQKELACLHATVAAEKHLLEAREATHYELEAKKKSEEQVVELKKRLAELEQTKDSALWTANSRASQAESALQDAVAKAGRLRQKFEQDRQSQGADYCERERQWEERAAAAEQQVASLQALLQGTNSRPQDSAGCAGLPNQQAAPGSWPASDAAHQAAMADGAQGGSMRDDMVPVTPPGDASRSAGLPDQAGGGPQAGQGPQAGLPQGNLVPNTSMPYVTSGGGQHLLHQVERKGDWWASATAVTAEQGDMAADGMGAMHRQSSASPSGGPAASAGDASQCQDGQESIPLAECKGQVQGTDAAATSEQGTGASQPNAAPASDVDDLADLMHGLDPRGKAVIDADGNVVCRTRPLTPEQMKEKQRRRARICERLMRANGTDNHLRANVKSMKKTKKGNVRT